MTDDKDKKTNKFSLNDNGKIIETVFNKSTKKTEYVYMEDGKIQNTSQYIINKKIFIPPKINSKIFETRVLVLPPLFTIDDFKYSKKDLAEIIEKFINKYVDMLPQDRKIATHYILMSWIYDKFHEIPYLRVMADYGSGKTRFLRVAGEISNKPIFASGGTTLSPIFRMIDDIRGTLIFDEADFERSDKTSDLVKILNAGYSKGGVVMRSEGKGTFEVKYFNVFGPKILANREPFVDQALESRFLVIKMKRTKRTDLPSQLTNEFYSEAENIRKLLMAWKFRNHSEKINFSKYNIENVQPRLKQISIPILATMEDEETINNFKKFIQKYNQDLLNIRSDGIEAYILKSLVYLEEHGNKYPTIKDINEKLSISTGWNGEIVTDKKVGFILRNILHLNSERKSNGFIINTIQYRNEIDSLLERYGMEREKLLIEMNDMNNMNIKVEDTSPFTNE